jgi:hypothetical protein
MSDLKQVGGIGEGESGSHVSAPVKRRLRELVLDAERRLATRQSAQHSHGECQTGEGLKETKGAGESSSRRSS